MPLAITAVYAGLNALIALTLAVRVSLVRVERGILFGDGFGEGGDAGLARAVRDGVARLTGEDDADEESIGVTLRTVTAQVAALGRELRALGLLPPAGALAVPAAVERLGHLD